MLDRLSALDAEFLHLEDDASPMHIGDICVFEGPTPTLAELTATVASRLHDLPRYRQVVETVPLELGRPIWVDDQHFRLDRHVHHASLPAPGGDAELDALMGRLMSHPLDRSRPLWEAWLIEGLDGDRWALVFKVHHCMVDGIAGIHLLEAFLDAAPHAEIADPMPWKPIPPPSSATKVLGSWVGFADDIIPWARRVASVAASPVEAAHEALAVGSGVWSFLAHLTPLPTTDLQGAIGRHRTWSHVSFDLDDVTLVRRHLGGTVNDVLLACVTAGHRALLLAHGDDPARAVVRTAIPVSTRAWSPAATSANRVSTLLAELPVAQSDPEVRLTTIRECTRRLKSSPMGPAADTLVRLADLAPPMVVGPVSRLATRIEHRITQRAITTITTNVPGPRFPLYCLGRELVEHHPFVGLTQGVRVSTAILSYNGRVSVGMTADEDAVPDVAIATTAMRAALAELVELAATTARTTDDPTT